MRAPFLLGRLGSTRSDHVEGVSEVERREKGRKQKEADGGRGELREMSFVLPSLPTLSWSSCPSLSLSFHVGRDRLLAPLGSNPHSLPLRSVQQQPRYSSSSFLSRSNLPQLLRLWNRRTRRRSRRAQGRLPGLLGRRGGRGRRGRRGACWGRWRGVVERCWEHEGRRRRMVSRWNGGGGRSFVFLS